MAEKKPSAAAAKAAKTAEPDEKPEKPKPKTAQERTAEKRIAKLEEVKEQVESGSLTIRQMSKKELDAFKKRTKRGK